MSNPAFPAGRGRSMRALGWMIGVLEECRVECKGEVSQACHPTEDYGLQRSRTMGYRGVWSLPP